MAISYPLTLPSNIGIAQIELRAVNAVAVSSSPFTYGQQVQVYDGQRWEADVSLPPMHREDAEAWVSFLLSLKGRQGTFLLYDPAAQNIRGTATTLSVAGNAGEDSIDLSSNGTLKAGDYIQIGQASDATLHKVLQDHDGATGKLEIWPRLRKDRTTTQATIVKASGLFRLASNETSWSVNDASFFGISFSAMEVV